MSYYILPKINNNLIVNPKCDSDNCTVYCSFSLYNYYNNIKSQIDSICLNEPDLVYNYNELIKIVNPYEYVFFTVPGSKYSVSKLKPNTNDFYDLLEIFMTLNILDMYTNKSIKSLHFSLDNVDTIDCIEMLRENYNDDIIINLNENNDEMYKTINDLKFDIMFFNKAYNDINSYIINFIKFVMNILRYQEFGGTTIIKIDYIFHKPIIDLLYLLSSLFEKVYIIKPNTSNITTFEKYIVCKNFNGSAETKLELYKNNYYNLSNFIKNLDGNNITSIIDNDIQYYFINKIDDMNIILGHQQLESLNQIINILKNKSKEEKIENIKKTSIQKAVTWCEKFKIPCNRFSEKTNIFLPIIKGPKEPIKIKDEDIILEDIEVLEDI
jgi:23S rRNA U2552 (ribose-2'-O)-methylase RlmE/FtsJ